MDYALIQMLLCILLEMERLNEGGRGVGNVGIVNVVRFLPFFCTVAINLYNFYVLLLPNLSTHHNCTNVYYCADNCYPQMLNFGSEYQFSTKPTV